MKNLKNTYKCHWRMKNLLKFNRQIKKKLYDAATSAVLIRLKSIAFIRGSYYFEFHFK